MSIYSMCMAKQRAMNRILQTGFTILPRCKWSNMCILYEFIKKYLQCHFHRTHTLTQWIFACREQANNGIQYVRMRLFIKYNGRYCWQHRWFHDYSLLLFFIHSYLIAHIGAWQRIFMLLSIVLPLFYYYYMRIHFAQCTKYKHLCHLYMMNPKLNASIFQCYARMWAFIYLYQKVLTQSKGFESLSKNTSKIHA